MKMTGPTEAQQFGMKASVAWWSDARELTVSFDQRSLESSIVAWIKLNRRDEISGTAPSFELYYKIMQEAFLSLYDAETVNPIYPITDLGQSFIDAMRRATGIGLDALPTPVPPQLSADDALDDALRNQIKQDWVSLPGDRVRQKANQDANYRRVLEEMLNSDAIADPVSSTFYKIDGPDFGSQNRY
jgi:hypothetical protein